MSEAGAAARVGSVYAAQEWGRLQFFLEQLGKVCSSLAGMRMAGLSPWEVTSSLSCRHKEKGAGVSRGEAGDHHSPGCPGSRSRRGSRCHPSRQACQGHSQLGPCPGWTTQPMGPSCPPSPPHSLTHPLCWALVGATHHALGFLGPQPGHPRLHVHLPARE